MEAVWGDNSLIDSWMQLVRKVRWNFPGLETEESINEHKQTVLKFMNKKQALCVRNKGTVVGVLLFSRSRNMICCLAVDPEHRKQGLASILLRKALDELDRSKEITVSTFRDNDDKGIAPRALYRKFGSAEVISWRQHLETTPVLIHGCSLFERSAGVFPVSKQKSV